MRSTHLVRQVLMAVAAAVLVTCLRAPVAQAQTTEERFQDLFVTAGYATAFGAALGTAVLFLNPSTDPGTHLRYIAVGASVGFIGGSAFGSYVIFSPLVTERQDGDAGPSGLAADRLLPAGKVVIRPTYDATTKKLGSIEGGMALARF